MFFVHVWDDDAIETLTWQNRSAGLLKSHFQISAAAASELFENCRATDFAMPHEESIDH